jgi:hypothetical protein
MSPAITSQNATMQVVTMRRFTASTIHCGARPFFTAMPRVFFPLQNQRANGRKAFAVQRSHPGALDDAQHLDSPTHLHLARITRRVENDMPIRTCGIKESGVSDAGDCAVQVNTLADVAKRPGSDLVALNRSVDHA